MLRFARMLLMCSIAVFLQVQGMLAQEGNGNPTYGNCTTYNQPQKLGDFSDTKNDSVNHSSGNHTDAGSYYKGSCQYSNPTNVIPGTWSSGSGASCNVSCAATAFPLFNDSGSIVPSYLVNPQQHVVLGNSSGGNATSNGPAVSCGSGVVTAVNQCSTLSSCNVSISMSAGSNGIGVSGTFPGQSPVWSHNLNYTNVCGAEPVPIIPPCTPTTPPPTPSQGNYYFWSTQSCSWVQSQCGSGSNSINCGGTSPILIDTDGSGFHLTSARDGVAFDFYGVGKPIQLGWTARESTNGWLALDRNRNGKIDSGQELFGNITQQPGSDSPNGFLALSMFDDNHDDVIDEQDQIWPYLLVWIDSNHDGVSQPGELHHLDDLGIHSISLKYTFSRYVDQFGNQFRYKGHIEEGATGENHAVYDVFLTTK